MTASRLVDGLHIFAAKPQCGSTLRVEIHDAERRATLKGASFALHISHRSRRRFLNSHSLVSKVANNARTSQRFQMLIGSSERSGTG